MNKYTRMLKKFINTIKNHDDDYQFYREYNYSGPMSKNGLYYGDHTALYHACYLTHAFSNCIREAEGADDICTYPLTDKNKNIVGISVYASFGSYTDDYYEKALHNFYFSAEQLRYIRSCGLYKGGFR